MDLDVVRYEVDDGIGLITLNRPDRLNAWTKQMQLQYRFCMATADADPLVKVIVVTGAGRGFCAGIDFDDLAGGGAVDNASVDMADSEILLLSRLIRSSDVIVNIFSTLNLEGAIFDRPLVNVCFEDTTRLYEGELTPRFDIGIDLRSTHNQRLLKTGGVRMVYSSAEMIDAVKSYLEEPSRERDERKRIVAQEIGPHHGNAGAFIADTLYDWAAARAVGRAERHGD